MEGGAVRAILAMHLAQRHPTLAASFRGDPNAMMAASELAAMLETVQSTAGEPALRQAAADYVALWARTFRTLVVHLRGRPERAVALFAGEVYPFLRGDRLAARVEAAVPGRARVRLAGDLPSAYLAGLLAAFVGLSGAAAAATPEANGEYVVTYRVAGRDRLARLVQTIAQQRLQILVCAVLAAGLGIALGLRLRPDAAPWRAALVLVGAVTVQVGANALHDLRHRHPAGPLDLRTQNRGALLLQARLGYMTATACGMVLAVRAPAVAAFALAGLAASIAFGHLKNRGWGPLVAGLIYGPLLALGAVEAVAPGAGGPATRLVHGLLALPSGLMAAAVLYVDDLADRPLDEAGGSRTLLVRLPRRRHVVGYAGLALGGVAGFGVALAALGVVLPFLVAALALGAVLLVALVRSKLDDPRALAPARFGTLALHAAGTCLLSLAVLGVLP